MQHFTTTPHQRQRELKNEGIQRVLHHLRAGHSGAAHEFLLQSVERQLRCDGVVITLPRPQEPTVPTGPQSEPQAA